MAPALGLGRFRFLVGGGGARLVVVDRQRLAEEPQVRRLLAEQLAGHAQRDEVEECRLAAAGTAHQHEQAFVVERFERRLTRRGVRVTCDWPGAPRAGLAAPCGRYPHSSSGFVARAVRVFPAVVGSRTGGQAVLSDRTAEHRRASVARLLAQEGWGEPRPLAGRGDGKRMTRAIVRRRAVARRRGHSGCFPRDG